MRAYTVAFQQATQPKPGMIRLYVAVALNEAIRWKPVQESDRNRLLFGAF